MFSFCQKSWFRSHRNWRREGARELKKQRDLECGRKRGRKRKLLLCASLGINGLTTVERPCENISDQQNTFKVIDLVIDFLETKQNCFWSFNSPVDFSELINVDSFELYTCF